MKKLSCLLLLLLVISCGKETTSLSKINGGTNELERNINNIVMFNVTVGVGAENISGAKVEARDKRNNIIAMSSSDSQGKVILNIPEYFDRDDVFDILISKEGFGQTRIQDYYMRKPYLGDIAIFKQPLFNLSEEELRIKGIERPVAEAPFIKTLSIFSDLDNDKRDLRIVNEQNYNFNEINKINLEIISAHPIGDDGHKWKGIRGDINNSVHSKSPLLNTSKTLFEKNENSKYVYNGSINVDTKLLNGDNFIEVIAQDIGANQVIKRIYIKHGRNKFSKNLNIADVVIRSYEFRILPHNHGVRFLPVRSIHRYYPEDKSDITTNRRMTLNFSVDSKRDGKDLGIRGFTVYYRAHDGLVWRELEKIVYSELSHGKKSDNIPEVPSNKHLIYNRFTYNNYDSRFETNKFYEFKIEVFDNDENILGTSNIVRARQLDFFSISPTAKYKKHGSDALSLPFNLDTGNINLNFQFGLIGLKDLEKSFNNLEPDDKKLIKNREVLFGFEMASLASGLGQHITIEAIRTGLPFVAKYNDNNELGLFLVNTYKENAYRISSDYRDYLIPGGEYNKLQVLDSKIMTIANIQEDDNFNEDRDYKINFNLREFWLASNRRLSLPGINFNTSLVRPGRTYQWDITGHPLLSGSHGYSSATYQEVYQENEIRVSYDINGDGVVDENDFILSKGMSKILINSRVNTPDGSYTVNITE